VNASTKQILRAFPEAKSNCQNYSKAVKITENRIKSEFCTCILSRCL